MKATSIRVPGYGVVDTTDLGAVTRLSQTLANQLHKVFSVVPSAVRKGNYAWVEDKHANGAKPLAVCHPTA